MNPNDLTKAGNMLAVYGVLNGALNSFYAAKNQQYELRSKASSLRYAADVSDLNAAVSDADAEQAMIAGQRAIGSQTMRAGQQIATAKTAMAANGVQLGDGSAAEALASSELMKQIDSLTINANAVRAAQAARTQAVNYRAQGMTQRMSADNVLTSADTISPTMAFTSSLIGGASTVARGWYRYKDPQDNTISSKDPQDKTIR